MIRSVASLLPVDYCSDISLLASAHRHYEGPVSNLPKRGETTPNKEKLSREDAQEV
jgi:hypothetical protein